MLEISVDLYQRWRRDYTIRNCVRSYGFQHGNVENRVDRSHGLGESEYKGVRAGLSDDFERSEEFFGKLSGGSGHVEILHFNIDSGSDLELRCRSPAGIHRTLIATLRIGDLDTEFLVELVQVHSEFSGTDRSHFAFWVHRYIRMITLVRKEWGNPRSGARSIVVGEFHQGQEFGPVVLLIIAVTTEVLFQRLVSSLRLSVALQVIPRSEVQGHIEDLAQQAEKTRDELRAMIRGDVRQNSVFREDMEYEQMSQLHRVHFVGHQDENPLLRKPINNH